MNGNGNQLIVLGQRVLDAIVSSYMPGDGSSMALALHPGQPIADELVQHGQANPLRLSEWIADQYDYPLWLKRADGTALSASLIGGLTAKAAYTHMVPWAEPSVPPGSSAAPRLRALIAGARKALGDNPEALPFGCEPTDFAAATSTAWKVFDTKIAHTETVTTVRPDTVQVNPDLWRLVPVSEELVTCVSTLEDWQEEQRRLRASLTEIPRYEVVERLRRIPDPMDVVVQPADHWIEEPAMALPAEEALRYDAVARLATVQISDVVAQPGIAETTTEGSELKVHFEHCLLTITRRVAGNRWWLPEFIAEDDWYVPGMKRGDMVKESTKEGYGHYLPQALLLVRNVRLTGSWTAAAHKTMQGFAYVGPFLTAAMSGSSVEEVSVLGVGVQVIGELCAPLPPLPPRDDPELT